MLDHSEGVTSLPWSLEPVGRGVQQHSKHAQQTGHALGNQLECHHNASCSKKPFMYWHAIQPHIIPPQTPPKAAAKLRSTVSSTPQHLTDMGSRKQMHRSLRNFSSHPMLQEHLSFQHQNLKLGPPEPEIRLVLGNPGLVNCSLYRPTSIAAYPPHASTAPV